MPPVGFEPTIPASKILPFPSLYIFVLLQFVTKNRELFTTNSEIHKFGTRHHNFHYPSATLTKYQEGVLYMGINIYNSLPTYIKKELTDTNKFVSLTRNFLCENSFYSLEEFYNFCKMK